MPPDRPRDRTAADGEPSALPVFGAPMAAAALVVAGVAVAFLPQHVATITRLLLGTLAVAALSLPLYRMVRSTAEAPSSELERIAWRRRAEDGAPGLNTLRSSLRTTGPATGAPLPPTVRRQLAAMIATVVDRHGIDPTDRAQRARLSAATWAVYDAERARRADGETPPEYRIRPATSAQIVHAVLDDLQRLDEEAPRIGRAPQPKRPEFGGRAPAHQRGLHGDTARGLRRT